MSKRNSVKVSESIIGEVTTWTMTEEERLAYIKKYPIRPIQREKGSSFANINKDYKWRGTKGAEANKRKKRNSIS